MARETLSIQSPSSHLVTPSHVAAVTDGHKVYNDGHLLLWFKNSNAATRTITIQTPGTVDGLAISEFTMTLPADTGEKVLCGFPPGVYNQSGTDAGMIYIDYSATAGVTVAAIQA